MKSWLDDPEWEDLHRRVNKKNKLKLKSKPQVNIDGINVKPKHVRPAIASPQAKIQPKPETVKEPKKANLSMNIPLWLSSPKSIHQKLGPKHKKWGLRIAIAATAILVINALALAFIKPNKDDSSTQGANTELSQQPDFPIVFPDGSREATSGETKYDPAKKVVSYKDILHGKEITISEQELPEQFKNDPAPQVEKIAKDFSADKALPTKSTKAFLGNSAQGPQSVVTWKKGILIFIFAPSAIPDSDWVEYIDNLQ